MKSTRITRSKAKLLAPGPSTSPTSHPHPLSIIITESLDDLSSVPIQSFAHPVMSHEQTRDTPPHQSAGTPPAPAPTLPAIDPQLQAAMMAMVEIMTRHKLSSRFPLERDVAAPTTAMTDQHHALGSRPRTQSHMMGMIPRSYVLSFLNASSYSERAQMISKTTKSKSPTPFLG